MNDSPPERMETWILTPAEARARQLELRARGGEDGGAHAHRLVNELRRVRGGLP